MNQNPYKILYVSSDASNEEIIQAVSYALQRRAFSAREIADAQKELMNPNTRKVADFVYFLGAQQWNKDIELPKDMMDVSELPLLHI
ncbi:MAG: hypothetical protein V1872_10735 [bacterium]